MLFTTFLGAGVSYDIIDLNIKMMYEVREGWLPQNSNLWKIQLVTDPQMASEVLKFILDHF